MRRLASLWFLLVAFTAHAGSYLAFSLREAANHIRMGDRSYDALHLAGITRVVGLAVDPSGDVILIGRKVQGLSGGTIDDLAVALRARLDLQEWPLVSIDPVEDTPRTHRQTVRFSGGLAGTQFGLDFLRCDIFLKKYSLELLPPVGEIHSFRQDYADEVFGKRPAGGSPEAAIQWRSAADFSDIMKGLVGRREESRAAGQIRFWFTPDLENAEIPYQDGVLCIKELRLKIGEELVQNGPEAGQAAPELTKAGALFGQSFGSGLSVLQGAEATLGRLKILYDLTVVAECLRQLDSQGQLDRADCLTYFRTQYAVKHVDTRSDFELLQLIGAHKRRDGSVELLQLSGGIQFQTEVKLLAKGYWGNLRTIVLKSRPSPNALSWSLPLESWTMPNSDDLTVDARKPDNAVTSGTTGCSVSTQAALIGPLGMPAAQNDAFRGFPPDSAPPPPLKGVSLKMTITDGSLKVDTSGRLEKVKDSILKGRQSQDSLNWKSQ